MKGQEVPMSLPSQAELDEIKESKGLEKVTNADLPRETVQNVILNSLANFVVSDRTEVFTVHALGLALLAEDEGEIKFTDKQLDFLTKRVLPQATRRFEGTGDKEEEKGIYAPWVMAQVYSVLGVTE